VRDFQIFPYQHGIGAVLGDGGGDDLLYLVGVTVAGGEA
jgi:hypothetical protein